MTGHAESLAGPSGSGTVVLELGPGAGALVLHVPAGMNGTEIELGLAGWPGFRTHSAVRPRHVPGGTRFAAVYPGLAPDDYVVLGDDDAVVATVTVSGGIVTTARWPGL
jgi:hypothetical protein